MYRLQDEAVGNSCPVSVLQDEAVSNSCPV